MKIQIIQYPACAAIKVHIAAITIFNVRSDRAQLHIKSLFGVYNNIAVYLAICHSFSPSHVIHINPNRPDQYVPINISFKHINTIIHNKYHIFRDREITTFKYLRNL